LSGLCILAAGTVVRLAVAGFTLSWMHSIEHMPLEDEYAVEGDHLRIVESRIKGSGAGIEPGVDARLVGGWYRWVPPDNLRKSVVLRRSGAEGTGDWTFCANGTCRPLGHIVPTNADPVVLEPCTASGPR
jgi:hypothetical protein